MANEKNPEKRAAVRTSLYLVRRTDALLGSIRFFAAGDRTCLLRFLAQSDFWEWELDNLIYSFTNLAERSQTWSSELAANAKLSRLGVAVDAKVLHRAKWRSAGNDAGRWSVRQAGKRIAPVSLLQETIEAWNALVDLAEAEFVLPMHGSAKKWNLQARPDLKSMRRTMPDLIDMDDVNY